MPRGFEECADLRADVNPRRLDQNCYFCTVAALKNVDVNALVAETETMQQNIANRDEIRRLFTDAGLIADAFVCQGMSVGHAGENLWNSAGEALNLIWRTLSTGQFCGVAFQRPDGTGHMVVAARQRGNPDQIVCADFQLPPQNRAITAWPPENGHNYRYIIWFIDEIEELTRAFSELSLS